MTTAEHIPDERLWELDITACDDGDILLRQGRCPECHDDVSIRLHRSHLPLIAETCGWLTPIEFRHAIDRYRDRLTLLVSMVRAHSRPGDPLRAVIDELEGPAKPPPGPLGASATPSDSRGLPGCSESDGGPSEPSLF